MALNCDRVNVPFGLLIVPFLIFSFPYLSFAALPACKRPVEIKLRKASVGIDVRKFAAVGPDCRGVILLLNGTEAQYSLCFTQLPLAGFTARSDVRAHRSLTSRGAPEP